jgi:hypothetical protein
MPEAQLYPGARWTPLGAQTEDRMRAHDILCLHTMVGYLVTTDPYFRHYNGEGFAGTESHYGVGGKWGPDFGQDLDGAVYQWQDRAFTADANLDGNYRVISIETADNAPKLPQDIEAWTPAQVEAIARILAWESSTAAHERCSGGWACHRYGIPLTLVPDSKPGRRGVAYHRQGIDPWRVSGGEKWSAISGKPCPTDRRIAQIPGVISRARVIASGDDKPEPPPPPPPPKKKQPEEAEMRVINVLDEGDPDGRQYLVVFAGGAPYKIPIIDPESRADLLSAFGATITVGSGDDAVTTPGVLVPGGPHPWSSAQLATIPTVAA